MPWKLSSSSLFPKQARASGVVYEHARNVQEECEVGKAYGQAAKGICL
jgi:hypothetical protein